MLMFAFGLLTYVCVHMCPSFHVHMFDILRYLRDGLCRCLHVQCADCIHVCPCMCIYLNEHFIHTNMCVVCTCPCMILMCLCMCDLHRLCVCVCPYALLISITLLLYVDVCGSYCLPSPIRPHSGAPSHFKCPTCPTCWKRLSTCRVCPRLCRLDLNGFSWLNEKQLCRQEGLACRKEEHWLR